MKKKNNGLSIIQLEERFEMVAAADRKREVDVNVNLKTEAEAAE